MAAKKSVRAKYAKEPWISNYPPLDEWIHKNEQNRCMWQQRIGGEDCRQDMVECWLVNGRPILILVYGDGHGWGIYTEADTSDIPETLADVELRVGLRAAP